MLDACREGRGVRSRPGQVMASATGVTDAGDVLVADAANVFTIVDAIFWSWDSVPTLLDFDLNIIDYFNGTRDFFTVEDDGDITAIAAVMDWLDPNPPANTLRGVMKTKGIALGPTSLYPTHTVTIMGNDATPGNNYTGTNAIALSACAHIRRVDEEAFE